MKKTSLALLSMALVGMSGCTGEMTGQLVGGSMGALLGSQIGGGKGNVIATALGAVAGVAVGGLLGKKFDENAKKKAEIAAQKAACTGKDVAWSDPSGACGTWKAGPIQYSPQHQKYRALKCLATTPDGKPVHLILNAYQGADGNWYMAEH